MELSLYSYAIPLKNPISLKRQTLSMRKGWILILRHKDKITYAEAAPLKGFSIETFEELGNLWHRLFIEKKMIFPLPPSVRFALSSLFLPEEEGCLPAYGLIIGSFSHMKPQIEKKAPLFSSLKIKYFPPLSSFVESLLWVKKHYPSLSLKLDINRKWTLQEAKTFASYFSPQDFEYLEEPFSQKQDFFTFSENYGFPLALDETLYLEPSSSWQKLPHVKALVIKPTLLGGLFSRAYLKRKKIKLIFSSSFESAVGLIKIAQLAYRWKSHVCLGLDTYERFSQNILKDSIRIEKGKLYFPKIQLNKELLCHHFTVPCKEALSSIQRILPSFTQRKLFPMKTLSI